MAWTVLAHKAVNEWLRELREEQPKVYGEVWVAIRALRQEGPTLGRPFVDRVHHSRHHNMKELRPHDVGEVVTRVLFAFDPERRAMLLVAGDKAGEWSQWYADNVPVADDRFDEHLRRMDQ